MRQFFVSLVVVVAAVAGQACATGGSLPYLVAANAAMPYQVLAAGQAVQPLYGGYGYGGVAVPVCRLQDLQGLPSVSQPVLVRVDKSRGHKKADIVAGALIVGGLSYLGSGGDARAGMAGAATGGGSGLAVGNHEQEICLYLPVAPVAIPPQPPAATTPSPPTQPPQAPPAAPLPGTRRVKL